MLFEEIVTNALMEGLDVSAIKEKYYPNIPEEDFRRIVAADPTSKNGARLGTYSKWLLSLYQHLPENERRRLVDEDLTKATAYLTVFDKYKNQLPQEARNINGYDSLPSLYDAVKQFMDNKPHTKGEMTRQIKGGAEKVYEDEKWLVVIPHTEEAACLYGAHTQWCTAAREDNMFDDYNKDGYLYINIDKQNNRKYQFHFESEQFMDETDENIPAPVLDNIGATPGLRSFYQKNVLTSDFLKLLYDDVGDFYEGLAWVKMNGKWGLIDKSGREVIPCKYDYARDFSEGLATVRINGKWGYIDKSGREVIPCKYNDVGNFSEGLAMVQMNGKYGYIDKEGNWYDKKPTNLQENTYLLSIGDIHKLINESLKKYKKKKNKSNRVPSAQEQVGGKVNVGLLDGAYGLMEEEPDFYIGMEGNSNAEYAHVSQGSAGAPMNEEMVWQHGSTPHKEMTEFKPNIQPLIMYKQFKLKLDKDGKNMAPGYVFPLYVNTAESGNNGGLRVGAWYKSGEGECWLDTENGRLYTKGKGYGVDGNKIDKLAYRPGWHLTTTPWGNQRGDGKVIGGKKGTGNNYRNTKENEVWAKVEICVDIDATERARERSLDPKYQSLDKLNDREFYKYKTNANASDAQSWYIVDTIRIIDILDDDTVDNTNDAFYQDFLKQNPDKSINSDPEDYTQSSENEIPYWKMPRKSGKRYSGEDLRGMGYYSAEPTRIDESKKLTKDEYLESFKSIGNYMDKNGLKVKPFPKVKIDNSEQDGLFIKTGYYAPEEKLVVLFTKDRHPKDILRSFTHEMVHHAQNLRGDDLSFSENDDVKNNERLEEIESEAYLKGNIYFRKWTEYFKNGEEKELLNESIKKSDIDFQSFKIQNNLNPKFWKDDRLDSKVRLSLLKIADDFIKWVGVKFKHSDIIITGSLANYTWNKKYSDIDLHILVDFSKFKGGKAFAKEFFSAKKSLWNEKHEKMKILGYPVEIYVQDTAEFHKSSGIYSLEKDSWIEEPDKEKLTKGKIDKKKVKDTVVNYADRIDEVEEAFKKAKNGYDLRRLEKDAEKILSDIKNERKSGFANNESEINDGNVIFKTLRRTGYIGKIIDLIDDIYDKMAGFEI